MVEMSTFEKSVLKKKLPPCLPTLSSTSNIPDSYPGGKRFGMRRRDYTPMSWKEYFSGCEDVSVDGNIFRIYSQGSDGPVLVLLHGGGFSALSWSLFTKHIMADINCRVLALDLRGHGETHTTDDGDLSLETLASDVGLVVKAVYGDCQPPVVLVGHSMGGAVAVHAAFCGVIPHLIGLAVIDVVEGTAMESLSSMQSFLRGRPKHFPSIANAIEWCVRSGQVRNLESARVSMTGQIKSTATGHCCTREVDIPSASEPESVGTFRHGEVRDCIKEETEESSPNILVPTPEVSHNGEDTTGLYTWRIDLGATERFWPGWFQGLSTKFLECPVPKLLLLAGIDRLDRELTIGQMQGKFQMQVLPHCGHACHEDVPDKVAEAVAHFMVRHKFTEAKADFKRPFPAC